MDEMMNSVKVQIQRAINDAISNQVLPQIQNAIVAGSGHMTKRGWNVPDERPELNSEVQRNLKTRSNLRNGQDESHQNGDLSSHRVHDTGRFAIEYEYSSFTVNYQNIILIFFVLLILVIFR